MTALEGVGLGFQIKNIPPGKLPCYPRGKFVVESLANTVWYFALADIGTVRVKSTPLSKSACDEDSLRRAIPKGAV